MSSSSASSRPNGTGQYTLCIEGLPSTYTWQDVKDLARNRAEHGIRANTVESTNARGEQITVSFVNVSRRNEALNLYAWLTGRLIEGNNLTVHVFDDSSKCFMSNCHRTELPCNHCRRPAAIPTTPSTPSWTSPPVVAPAYTYTPIAVSRYTATPSLSQYTAPPIATRPDSQQMHAAAATLRARVASGIMLDPNQEEFLRRFDQLTMQEAPRITQPIYAAAAASGAPINTSNGFARTEIRGVFVQGLDFKTRSAEVKALFSKAGTVTKCEVHVNSQGKSKGTATIQFATTTDARHAVQDLNGFKWKGRVLKVRNDREAVVTEVPVVPTSSQSSSTTARRDTTPPEDQEPTIVDGSNSRQARRDSKVASIK